MEYGSILKGSWETIWKHKVIIWFGFLIVIPSLIMGLAMGSIFYFFEDIFSFTFEPYAQEPDISPVFIILFVAFFMGFTLLSYATTALSFAGVVKGTADLEKLEDNISFGELWHVTLPYVWRVFGIFFLIFFLVFSFIGVFMFFGALVGAITAGLALLCLLPIFLLILPLELLAYLYASLAIVAVIVEDIGVFNALGRAWEVMKKKFWPLVLMALILAFIQWALSMILLVPMQGAQFFIMFSTDVMSYAPDPETFFKPFAILMAIFMPLSSLVQGLGMTYANASWTLTYKSLTQTPPTPESPVFVEPNA